METKQKKGWLKYALTTAMATVFTVAMAVTAMAGTHATVSLPQQTPTTAHDLILNANFDFPAGAGVATTTLNLTWDPAVLTASFQSVPDSHLAATNPGAVAVNQGNINWIFMANDDLVNAEPSLNATQSGPMGTIRFVLNPAVAAGDIDRNVTVTAVATNADYFDASGTIVLLRDSVGTAITAPQSLEFNLRRLIWNYYGNTAANQIFIDAVIPGGSAHTWFTYVDETVLPAVRATIPNATFEQAVAIWEGWIASAAA